MTDVPENYVIVCVAPDGSTKVEYLADMQTAEVGWETLRSDVNGAILVALGQYSVDTEGVWHPERFVSVADENLLALIDNAIDNAREVGSA